MRLRLLCHRIVCRRVDSMVTTRYMPGVFGSRRWGDAACNRMQAVKVLLEFGADAGFVSTGAHKAPECSDFMAWLRTLDVEFHVHAKAVECMNAFPD